MERQRSRTRTEKWNSQTGRYVPPGLTWHVDAEAASAAQGFEPLREPLDGKVPIEPLK